MFFRAFKNLSKKLYQGEYSLHQILSFQGIQCSHNAHVLFGAIKFIKTLRQGQYSLTIIFLFKDSIKISLKPNASFSVSKVFKKFQSRKYT